MTREGLLKTFAARDSEGIYKYAMKQSKQIKEGASMDEAKADRELNETGDWDRIYTERAAERWTLKANGQVPRRVQTWTTTPEFWSK
jgi:hypothetical protein